MPATIPASHTDLLDGPVYVVLSTLMADGSIQSNPVWCSRDGNDVLINTAVGRVKDRNLRERKIATVFAMDPQNPYRWIEVRGEVAEIVAGDGADAHIDDLAELYLGQRPYPFRQPGEQRVMYRLRPVRVNAFAME
ncbi:MAG: PPOX class F420-dependent oxidoreductase [Candidatus Dadabacteria bacterium]|nr:MAG: PPOX class F420-dependent oxidoreductase [Candidatus Dadabacteria bacterium]